MSTLKTTLLTLFVSLSIWFILPVELELARKVPAFFAAISMLSMAMAMLISCRTKWLDRLIGGIDKAYVWHKWLGISGVLGASFHWLLVPGPAGNGIDPTFADFGEEVGQWAMYGLILLGAISMVRQIPYRIWYYTHMLMGPIFIISVYHTFFSDVPFSLTSVTGITLLMVSAIGIVSWVYKIIFKKRHFCAYTVSDIKQIDNAVEVTLEADSKTIDYQVGQFAYLDFNLDKVSHFHPFTITSHPSEQQLSFIIRNLGKHTEALQTQLAVGQKVTVDGGYGQLMRKKKASQPQVWLAGGIGITPFLSWIKATASPEQEVHLFFVGRGKFYRLMVQKVTEIIGTKNIQLHIQDSEQERLSADGICEKLSLPLSMYQVFGCGPTPMLSSLKKQLVSKGLKPSHWHNENFVMR